MNYSTESLNAAAANGKKIGKLDSDSLIEAFYHFRDNGQYKPGTTELVLCVKAGDYLAFIAEPNIKEWMVFTKNKQLHDLGLDGSIQGITVFTDAFLPKEKQVLSENVLLKLPNTSH